MKAFFLLISYFSFCTAFAQITVRGTVFDISKINVVENVRVVSSGGMFAITDSAGRYQIPADEKDSLSFVYNNKPTHQFAVSEIKDPESFDISLRIKVPSKYVALRDVTVFAKSYRQDSIENRETYADIFEYRKPAIRSGISPGGVAGADVNELINIFRFRRNRQLKAFQQRLEIQEQEKYINHRFNKLLIKRITGLTGASLDSFLIWYRPEYEFLQESGELEFNQYLLNALEHFQKTGIPVSPARKEDTDLP